jgi:uncharacterized protein YaaR (DUF327 family)
LGNIFVLQVKREKPKDFWEKVINMSLMKNLEVKILAKRLKKMINQVESGGNTLKNTIAF